MVKSANVLLQDYFSKPTAMDTYSPPAFDQGSKAYATTTMMRNSAMAKLKELQDMKKQRTATEEDSVVQDESLPVRIGGVAMGVNENITPDIQNGSNAVGTMARASQKKILGAPGTMTQAFGNRSGVEKYSGGVNYGTDFAVPRGTPVAAPEGDWVVVEAFNKATKEGPGNAQGGINRGYGNSVLIQNTKTGEKLRYSHLRVGGVNVADGQKIPGGTVIGETGASGNTAGRTGQHLDLEYYDQKGRLNNVMNSQYRSYL